MILKHIMRDGLWQPFRTQKTGNFPKASSKLKTPCWYVFTKTAFQRCEGKQYFIQEMVLGFLAWLSSSWSHPLPHGVIRFFWCVVLKTTKIEAAHWLFKIPKSKKEQIITKEQNVTMRNCIQVTWLLFGFFLCVLSNRHWSQVLVDKNLLLLCSMWWYFFLTNHKNVLC